MIKALKIVMIVCGVLVVLSGLALIFMPDQMPEYAVLGENADQVKWIVGLLGAIWVAAGAWLIVASRDPIRNINWVKFAITWFIIGFLTGMSSIIQGNVEFRQVTVSTLFDGIFAVAFLAPYPWRAVKQQKPKRIKLILFMLWF